MLTKDEVSDLKSFVERVVECEKSLLVSQNALTQARNNLSQTLWKFEHEKNTEDQKTQSD